MDKGDSHRGDSHLTSAAVTQYTYDPAGNRRTSHLSMSHRTAWTRKADPAQGETYTYDLEDQLIGYTKPGVTATYRYDALGLDSPMRTG